MTLAHRQPATYDEAPHGGGGQRGRVGRSKRAGWDSCLHTDPPPPLFFSRTLQEVTR